MQCNRPDVNGLAFVRAHATAEDVEAFLCDMQREVIAEGLAQIGDWAMLTPPDEAEAAIMDFEDEDDEQD